MTVVDDHVEALTRPRARVRLWQVLVLGAAALLFAAAVWFLESSTRQRDDAVRARRGAEDALATAHAGVQFNEERLKYERGVLVQRASALEPSLPAFQRDVDIITQLTGSAATIQRLGEADAESSDDFRNVYQHANDLVRQNYTALQNLSTTIGT